MSAKFLEEQQGEEAHICYMFCFACDDESDDVSMPKF